jgi:hypothetical protein
VRHLRFRSPDHGIDSLRRQLPAHRAQQPWSLLHPLISFTKYRTSSTGITIAARWSCFFLCVSMSLQPNQAHCSHLRPQGTAAAANLWLEHQFVA